VNWQFCEGHGWRDLGKVPAEVSEAMDRHTGQGEHALFYLQATSHLKGLIGCHEAPLFRDTLGIKDFAYVFNLISELGRYLKDEDADVISLIFVNFDPVKILPRLDIKSDTFSLAEALVLFSRAVVGSIDPSEPEAACEWAMISCTRQPGQESP
jgi:hypothetical protein